MRPCLRLNADDKAPNPVNNLRNQIHCLLSNRRGLGLSGGCHPKTTLSEAPGGDLQGRAIAGYTQDIHFGTVI